MKSNPTNAAMNQAAVSSSSDSHPSVQPYDSATTSSSSCRPPPSKQKLGVLRLSLSKSFLPRPISPTKEQEALQLAWEILNDHISVQYKASTIRDNHTDDDDDINETISDTSENSSSTTSS